ncbi:MAG: PTS ascorbate transporter subunit IIC [Gemmiger sp.]|nr:PTS ascorbate transporter subunit IIC [Gemmiger sp.]
MAKEDKKQVPLRLSASLYQELAAWAENDFRSLNGQIEFLLTECVRYRKRTARDTPALSEVPEDAGAPLPPQPDKTT